MSLISMLEKRTGALDDKWYNPGGFFYGGSGIKTHSGSQVSELNAMQLSVVWCCIKILSEDTASLPLHFYRRRKGGGRDKAVDDYRYALLHDSPNPEMTAMSFRETYMSHLVSWGNAYAEKEYGKGLAGRKRVVALWPITPNRVTVKRNERKEIIYHVSMAGTGLADVDLSKEKILHTPGLSFNGLDGYSPIAMAREAIGLGKSLEEFGALYFGQGIHPSAVVTHPSHLENAKELREAMNETYGGLGKSHRLMLLEEGMSIAKLGIPNDDAQFLESKNYQNVDIGSRIYRLPPQMYGEFGKASTYASAEQFSLDYVVKALRPWLVRLEQSYNMSLLTPEEQGEYFYEHLIDGLMRGDAVARADFYNKLFAVGGITPNKIAELENWNPIGEEGDTRFVPLNYVPLEDAGKEAVKAEKNQSIYRTRLESAYRSIFADAVERIERQESNRVNWLKKNSGNIDEFYRDFPEYIEKQLKPVLFSYSEAISGMESELNGFDYEDLKADIEGFTSEYCRDFALDYAQKARNSEQKPDNMTIISAFSGAFLRFLNGKQGGNDEK
jgi:HK97 family phage portal protein